MYVRMCNPHDDTFLPACIELLEKLHAKELHPVRAALALNEVIDMFNHQLCQKTSSSVKLSPYGFYNHLTSQE